MGKYFSDSTSIEAVKVLKANCALFAMSAVQMLIYPDAYITGEVSYEFCYHEKRQFFKFLAMWMINSAFNAYAQAQKPTKEICAFNMVIWFMWTVSHVFGVVFDPSMDAGGVDKMAVFIWPVLGITFIWSYYQAMQNLATEEPRSFSIDTPYMISIFICFMNIAVFLGHPQGADVMYYPNAPHTDAAGDAFNAWHKTNCGLMSLSNAMAFYSMRNSTPFQDQLFAAVWLAWSLFFVWICFIDVEMIENLGVQKLQFFSWIAIGNIVGFVFWKNGKRERTIKKVD